MSLDAGRLTIANDEIDGIGQAQPLVVDVPQPTPRAASASDPLAPFMALSAEEKIAVFT